MRNGTTILNRYQPADRTLAAMEEMELYCVSHPRSPAAVRRPRLSIRGRTFVALLGSAIEEGIAGFGDSVQAALRAFDAQYSRSLTPPADRD
jgi:anti-sigma factor RsiW